MRPREPSAAGTVASFSTLDMHDGGDTVRRTELGMISDDDAGDFTRDSGDEHDTDAVEWRRVLADRQRRQHRAIYYTLLAQLVVVFVLLLWSGGAEDGRVGSVHDLASAPSPAPATVSHQEDAKPSVAVVGLPPSLATPAVNDSSLCTTPSCVHAAADYRADMDTTVDPCDDFYQYACGGWIRNHPLDGGRSRLTRFDTLHTENQQVLREILDSADPPVRIAGMTDVDWAQDKANLDKCRAVFHACMDTDALDHLGTTPILDLVAIARSFGNNVEDADAPKVLAQTTARLAQVGIAAFIQFYIASDIKAPVRNVVKLSQAGLTFNELEAYKRVSVMHEFAPRVAEILGRLESPGHPDAGVSQTRRDQLLDIAQSIKQFEISLATIQVGQDRLIDPEATYNPYHVQFAVKEIPAFDLAAYLDTLVQSPLSVNVKFEPTTKLLITIPAYMQNLSDLIQVTSKDTIAWYLVWRVVTEYGSSLDRGTEKLLLDLQGLVSGAHGTLNTAKRWEKCVSNVENYMNSAVVRYYVQRSFPGDSREISLQIADAIIDAFRERAKGVSWLDEKTRQSVLDKLNLVKKKVGYPNSPSLDSPRELADFYARFNVTSTTHFANTLSWQTWDTERSLKKLEGVASSYDDWGMSAISANAFYERNSNEIVFPAGILRLPYFDKELPDYANLGAIGMFMGHELSHGFDDAGRKYDGHGRLESWWTKSTEALFQQRSDCFADQFGKFSVQGPQGQIVYVNTNLTMSEILADTSGLNQAEWAWRKRMRLGKGRNWLLPGMGDDITADRLFFQSYGRSFCAGIRPEAAILRIHTDSHPPLNHRVNGALQNSAGFAKAFNCKLGSKMNPERKCQLW